jgi:hypothetical protein
LEIFLENVFRFRLNSFAVFGVYFVESSEPDAMAYGKIILVNTCRNGLTKIATNGYLRVESL